MVSTLQTARKSTSKAALSQYSQKGPGHKYPSIRAENRAIRNSQDKQQRLLAREAKLQAQKDEGKKTRPASYIRGMMNEIRRLQNTTDLQIPRAGFQRLVRRVMEELRPGDNFRFQRDVLLALQEASENHITRLHEKANLVACHAKRVTIFPRDVQLVFTIRDEHGHVSTQINAHFNTNLINLSA